MAKEIVFDVEARDRLKKPEKSRPKNDASQF